MHFNSIKTRLTNHFFQPWLYLLNPVLRWKLQRDGAWGVVYMLHRVKEINPDGVEMNERMNVRPAYLESVICKYMKQGFNFLSLDQLHDVIQKDERPSHPFVVFTLDDGYVDNYTTAWPIFRKYNIPFAVYVATDFPDHKANLWWYALEDYLSHQKSISMDGHEYNLTNKKELDSAFRILRAKILNSPQEEITDTVSSLIGISLSDLRQYVVRESMSWEQIVEMSKDPLCTICGHTVSHPAFNALSSQGIVQEVKTGCQRIQEHTRKTVSHFAYPYGSPMEVGEREMSVTENLGLFKTITTCYNGFVGGGNNKRIPRMMLIDKAFV